MSLLAICLCQILLLLGGECTLFKDVWILTHSTFLPPAYIVGREGNVFTGINLSVHKAGVLFPGGTPVPGSFPGLWSQVLSRGTPVPGSFPGLWSQVLSWGVPQSWPSGGTPGQGTSSQDRTGVPPQLGQDWGTPLRQNSRVSTCMWWVVCLLQSHRKTFL